MGILSVVNTPETVKKFLSGSLCKNLKGIFISGDTFPPRPKVQEYIDYLILNKSNIKEELWLRLFYITEEDLVKIFNNFGHLKTIGFYDCSFGEVSKEIRFEEGVKLELEKLSFEDTLDNSLDSGKINNILTAIAETGDVKLKELNMKQLMPFTLLVRSHLAKLGLDVKIVMDKYWYFYNL
mmetsp:Transcript_11977/g.13512  ORF Transcript_11977/g.13512 Transcript_11977/m.13512 type:complete len:181 (+) Transcript_11977:144-686(+)